jgi:hypothetical protein
MKQDLEINGIVSDPNFDVEKFLYCIDLHESNPTLVPTLMNDPSLFLYIAESPYYQTLNRHVERGQFSEDIFKHFNEEMGLEVWTKETKSKNLWYGVIASDELAIGYRRVRWRREVEVWQGKNAAAEARSRWSSLKMYKLGDDVARTEARVPGERPIDLIRTALISEMQSYGWGSSYQRRRAQVSPRLYLRSSADYYKITQMNITTKGRKNIQVALLKNVKKQGTWGQYTTTEVAHETVIPNVVKDVERDPKEIAKEVLTWLKSKGLKSGK